LPAPDDGWYLARDTEWKSFFVVVGKRKRTFAVQGDLRKGGKRASSIRVSIGDTREMSTRTARATAKEYLSQISLGRHPKVAQQNSVSAASESAEGTAATLADATLRQAWQRYLAAHLLRKGRSDSRREKTRRRHQGKWALYRQRKHANLACDLQTRAQDEQEAAF
jgi:hypothetical protein